MRTASRFIQASISTSPVSCCWAMTGTSPSGPKRISASARSISFSTVGLPLREVIRRFGCARADWVGRRQAIYVYPDFLDSGGAIEAGSPYVRSMFPMPIEALPALTLAVAAAGAAVAVASSRTAASPRTGAAAARGRALDCAIGTGLARRARARAPGEREPARNCCAKR